MILSDIADALLGLGVIAAAAGLVAVGHLASRDRTADEHDLSDYRPAPDRPGLHPSRRDWPLLDADRPRRRLRPGALVGLADPAVCAVTPPTARRLLVEMAVPTLTDAEVADRAARMLAEIAAEQRGLAVA